MNDNPSFLATTTRLVSHLKAVEISVLLVDDQAIVAEALKRMLKDQPDIVLHYCSHPAQAIAMAAEVKPTVILQDLVMPEFDGLVLVKYFKANAATQNIPIVVLSTKEDPQIKAEAFAVGANDYIVKLPDRLELIARIRYHSNAYIRLLERDEAFKRLEESQMILQTELAEAAAYVRSQFPPPMSHPINIDWRFIPSTQLSGDSFGYHWLDDRHLAIYLMDVCGHGVGAALHSISVINTIRFENLPKANFLDPKSVLSALNLAFQMEKHNNMFFTIWYGVYDRETRKILYATGGHPPAILVTGATAETAKIVELKTPGIVIGAFPEAVFENAEFQIQPYNRLYIFSDGAYEISRADGIMLKLNEFIQLLSDTRYQKKSALDFILQFIQNYQGKPSYDDDASLMEITF